MVCAWIQANLPKNYTAHWIGILLNILFCFCCEWEMNKCFFVVINFIQSNLKFITTQTNQQSTNQQIKSVRDGKKTLDWFVCVCVCATGFYVFFSLRIVVCRKKKNKNINVCHGHLESKFLSTNFYLLQ